MRASVFFSGLVVSLALSGCQSGGPGDDSETGGSGGDEQSHGSSEHSAGNAGTSGKASNGGGAGSSGTTAQGGAGSNGGNEATGGSAGTAGSTGKGGSVGKGGGPGTGGGKVGKGGGPGAGGGSVGKGGSADAGVASAGGRQGTGGGADAGNTPGSGGQAGGTGLDGSVVVSSCTGGKAWPTANPTAAGPFEVAADKNVGPLAGYTPDPIYEDQQQRFNVYRPKNLADSGYCHPILIWANGHTDNPEPNPPKCVVDQGANKWCGQYLPLMNHLASHGFVVVASLSTTTSRGDPLPTIAGLNWILEQAEDSSSPYYHRLDTANIGQLGHSEGGMSTCMSAAEPRYKALGTICGTRTLTGVHTPMMFFCGGKDTTVPCSGVRDVFLTVKDQPAILIEELASDHGSWVYQKANGVSLSAAAAWFRVHLMGDTANRKYFFGSNCTFCTDSRAKVEQNSLMTQ